jgi:hypothetical protein
MLFLVDCWVNYLYIQLTLLVEQSRKDIMGVVEFMKDLEYNCQFLQNARITAINLANAFAELRDHATRLKGTGIIKLRIGLVNFLIIFKKFKELENLCLNGKRESVCKMICCYVIQSMLC